MTNKVICFLLYYLIGLGIYSIDLDASLLYFTVIPIHYYFVKKSIYSKNVLLLSINIVFFISFGLASVLLYINKTDESPVGYLAIGNFDFSLWYYFKVYSYTFIFCLILNAYVFWRGRKVKNRNDFLLPFVLSVIKQFTLNRGKDKTNLLIFFVLLFSIVSVWMFTMHIGMVGLNQTELPYHLTGILFYTRRIVFPIIILVLYLKSKNKKSLTLLLVLYSFVIGITATSKSIGLIVLIPIAIIHIAQKNIKWASFVFLSSFVLYYVVGTSRDAIFFFDGDIPYQELFGIVSNEVDFEISDIGQLLFNVTNSLCGRLMGIRSVILGYQYDGLSFIDCLSYYSMITPSVIPDLSLLFGVELPDDKSFGLNIGMMGIIQLLSCHNFLLTIFQAIIYGEIIYSQQNFLNNIIKSKANYYIKILSISIVALTLFLMLDAQGIVNVYICTLLLFIIKEYVAQVRCKHIVFNR